MCSMWELLLGHQLSVKANGDIATRWVLSGLSREREMPLVAHCEVSAVDVNSYTATGTSQVV